jgi:3-hydroxyisobutyrate dehydrogenase
VGDVAVVGLGDLGLACALRLHELGLEPVGVDSAAARRAEWKAATGQVAADRLGGLSVARVLLCVRTTSQAQAILAALQQCGRTSDLAVYVLTTLEPAFARGLDAYASASLHVIELPVSGGRSGARSGELTVLVGGGSVRPEDEAFLKRTLAREAFIFPHFGDATLVKLINNALAAYNASAFASCLALADQAGLAATDVANVILSASGASWIAAHFAGLVDDLLAKDAALLAGELGELPTIDISDAPRFLAGLRHSRCLIS